MVSTQQQPRPRHAGIIGAATTTAFALNRVLASGAPPGMVGERAEHAIEVGRRDPH